VHDYRRQVARGAEYRPSADTVNGVLLTSLSSVIGFGSLIVSAHQGMFSLGLCMAIGISGCLVASLIPLPAILAIVARHQPPVMTPVSISASEDETPSQGSQAKKQSSQQTRKAA
jgi:predicted RND superfamily exporter protein